MRIRKYFSFSSKICSSLLLGTLFATNNPASAYESLEWQQNGMFGDIKASRARSYSAARKIRKTKPSKLGKIRRVSGQKSPSKKRSLRKQSTHSHHRVKYASLGNSIEFVPPNRDIRQRGQGKLKGKRRIPRGVIWAANPRCLSKKLKATIYHVARNWGRVRVNSTCRSRKHNRRVGGSKHSYHLSGRAADIRVWGNVRAAARYLRKVSGGYKHYGGGLFHIDTGPRRTW